MVQKLRQRMGREEGFTLVELLVVMLILGLLAAIAIPSFFNQRDKASDADAKSGARSAQTAMETFATDNNNSYAGADIGALEAIEPTLGDVDLQPPVTAVDSYTVAVESSTGTQFSIQRTAAGETILSCDAPETGGCPADQDWGD